MTAEQQATGLGKLTARLWRNCCTKSHCDVPAVRQRYALWVDLLNIMLAMV